MIKIFGLVIMSKSEYKNWLWPFYGPRRPEFKFKITRLSNKKRKKRR
jgi:hypothetical protein